MPSRTRRIRRNTYLTVAASITAFAGYSLHVGGVDPLDARNMGYAIVTILDGVGLWNIKRNVDIWPIYSVEKGLGWMAFFLLTVLVFTGYQSGPNSNPWAPFLWIGILILSKLVAMEFILRQNLNPKKKYRTTAHGLTPIPTRAEANELTDAAAAELRHNNVDREYIAQIIEALEMNGLLEKPHWVEAQLQKMRQRRQRIANGEEEVPDGGRGSPLRLRRQGVADPPHDDGRPDQPRDCQDTGHRPEQH